MRSFSIGMACLAMLNASAADGQVKISQFYGGGNVVGGTYNADYVELFNAGSTPAVLDGWSLQTNTLTVSNAWHRTNLTGTIQPGHYFLIQNHALATGTPVGIPIPSPDLVSTLTASSTASDIGRTFSGVALVNDQVTLPNGCPLPLGSNIVDFVRSYDPAGADPGFCMHGTNNAPIPPTFSDAVYRKGGGCADTEDDFADFEIGLPNPRNSGFNGFLNAAWAPSFVNVGAGGSVTLTVSKSTIPCNALGTLTGVTADLSGIGGSAMAALVEGPAGVFTIGHTVPGTQPQGVYTVPINVTTSGGPATTVARVRVRAVPPANDDCATAIDMNTLGLFNGPMDNTAAEVDQDTGPCGLNGLTGGGVWFRYTPAQDELLQMADTSAQDVNWAVFTGSCASLSYYACFTGEGTETNPQARVRVLAGVQYHILVGQQAGFAPTVPMQLAFTTSPAPAPPSNDTCATAEPISTFPFTGTANADNARDDPNFSTCIASFAGINVARHGIWYSFTTSSAGRLNLKQATSGGSANNPAYAVWSGTCGSLTQIGCGSSAIEVPAPGSYFLQVYMNNHGLPPNGAFLFNLEFFPRPANDDCVNATDIGTPLSNLQITQSILAALDDPDIGCNTVLSGDPIVLGRGVWFKFTAPAGPGGVLSISVANQTALASAFAYYGACPGAELGCGSSSGTSTRFATVAAGSSLFIVVGENLRTSSERTDPIVVDFQFVPFVSNDSCATAEDLNTAGFPNAKTYNQFNAADLPTPNPCSTGATARQVVWFKWTSNINGRVRVEDTQGVQNADFRIFTAPSVDPCNNLSEYACISDANDRGSFTVAPGVTYYIAVNNGGNAPPTPSAPYILTFTAVPSPDASDLCSGATVVSTLPHAFNIANVKDYGDDSDVSCNSGTGGSAWHGVWFTITPADNIAITVSEASSTPTVAALYTSCSGVEQVCRSVEDHYFELTAGQQYWILLAYDSSSGPLGPTATNAFVGSIYRVDRLTNDDKCAAVQVGATPFSARVNLEQATPDEPAANVSGCNTATATVMRNSVWYKLVVTGTGNLTGTINPDFGTAVDGVFALYSSSDNTCNGTFTRLHCDDTPEPLVIGATPNPTVTLTAGSTYFLQVGKFGTSTTSLAGVSDIALTFSGTLQPPCATDYTGDGQSTVPDIFAFLTLWFAGSPSADFNGLGGVTVADIFAFLTAWFSTMC